METALLTAAICIAALFSVDLASGYHLSSVDIKDAVQIQKQHGTLISRLMDINKSTKIITLLFSYRYCRYLVAGQKNTNM